MTELSLLNKYRPSTWEAVVGQDRVVDSLAGAIEKRKAHAFLFTGPSGTGKTTLARIAAAELNCVDIEEIDAATYTGIDDMRAITSALMYKPLGTGNKAIILDECHMLSRNAWTSLLKAVENPPSWVYWFFCTTEGSKVLTSVKTRCVSYELKPVATRVLTDLLARVVTREKLSVGAAVIALCAQEANGSPRKALANLVTCSEVQNVDDARELLSSAIESKEAIDLARALYNGTSWADVQRLLANTKDVSSESIRQVVRAYGTKIALGNSKPAVVGRALEILGEFDTPFNPHDGLTPVVLACARLTLR